MPTVLRSTVDVVRSDLRPFLWLNAGAFGILLVGMLLGLLFPDLVAAQAAGFEESGQTDLVLRVFGNPWLFALTILAVNTLTVGAALIVLPSMVVPFLGLPLFAWKALTIGIALTPTTPTLRVAFIPHSLTVLIEFEAYVLLLLGAWVLGRAWLRPASVGASTRREAYGIGVRRLGRLVLAALLLLVVGALWEAWSLTRLVPWLVHTLL
ncbi:stage II sporulation protein M [Phycicoccus jejuensis]|uniref:stage II sporulation protein M n=1 Tax=Phycicoccus jejuensis TaxID=367299 RepID=UPI00055DE751|nr:stage II sporulation protein M [Phycicoccus jejuensis]